MAVSGTTFRAADHPSGHHARCHRRRGWVGSAPGASASDRGAGLQALERLKNLRKETYVFAYSIALMHAGPVLENASRRPLGGSNIQKAKSPSGLSRRQNAVGLLADGPHGGTVFVNGQASHFGTPDTPVRYHVGFSTVNI